MTSLDVIASGALHRMPACGRQGVQGGACLHAVVPDILVLMQRVFRHAGVAI